MSRKGRGGRGLLRGKDDRVELDAVTHRDHGLGHRELGPGRGLAGRAGQRDGNECDRQDLPGKSRSRFCRHIFHGQLPVAGFEAMISPAARGGQGPCGKGGIEKEGLPAEGQSLFVKCPEGGVPLGLLTNDSWLFRHLALAGGVYDRSGRAMPILDSNFRINLSMAFQMAVASGSKSFMVFSSATNMSAADLAVIEKK